MTERINNYGQVRRNREATMTTGTSDSGAGGRGRRRSYHRNHPEGYYYIPRKEKAHTEPIASVSSNFSRSVSPSHSRPRSSSSTPRREDPPEDEISRYQPPRKNLRSSTTTPTRSSPGSPPRDSNRRSRSSASHRRRCPPSSPSPPPQTPRSRTESWDRRRPSPSSSRSRSPSTPAKSWDGRARHYGKHNLKSESFDESRRSRERDRGRSGNTPKKLLSMQSTRFGSRLPSDVNASSSMSGIGSTSSNTSGRPRRRPRRNKNVTASFHGNAGGQASRCNSNRAVATFKMTMSKKEATSFFKQKMLPLVPIIGSGSCKKRYGSHHTKRLGDGSGGNGRKERGGKGEGDSTTYFSDCSEGSRSSFCSSKSFSSRQDSETSYCSYHRGGSQDECYYDGCDSYEGSYPSDIDRSCRSSVTSSCVSVSSRVTSRGRAPSSRLIAGKAPRAELRNGQIIVPKLPTRTSRAEKLRCNRLRGRREDAAAASHDREEEEEEEGGDRSQQRMVWLCHENERLRTMVVALRGDFEALLRRMGSVGRQRDNDGEDSIITNDSAAVSQSIERMRNIRELAFEKMEGEFRDKEERRSTRKTKDNLPKPRSEVGHELTSEQEEERERAYQECIDDLLCENERLYQKIEILREVQTLRSSSSNDSYTSKNDVSSGPILDKEMSELDGTVTLIPGTFEVESDKQKKGRQVDMIGMEIMELMSKVMSHQQVVAAVASDIDDNSQKQKESQIKQQQQQQEEEAKLKQLSTDIVGGKITNNLELSLCTVLPKSGYEDNEDRSCVNSEQSCSLVVESSNDVSSNSLFDGTSPSTVCPAGRGVDNDNDSDTSNLGVIHEYHNDGDFEGSAAPFYSGKGRQAVRVSSSIYQDNHVDDGFDADSYSEMEQDENARYCHDGSYRSFFSDDEMIESTPGGYLRYSATSSNCSPYSSSGSATRNVYLSKAALHHHQHQCSKATSSGWSSDAFQSENIIKDNGASNETLDLGSEDDKQHGNTHKQYGHDMTAAKLHCLSTPITCIASVTSVLSSDNTPFSLSSSASTKERQGIGITVVSRSSYHESFPSSPAHTYKTFFRSSLLKSQVDAILAEQFQETKETLEPPTVMDQGINKATRKSKKYQGELNEEGKYHGYGIYISKNGNEYRGEWRNGKREGLGVVKIGNGDIFEGQFESNLKNGIGAYHFMDGECDLSCYRDDVRVGDTMRYSKDRQRAFLLSEVSGSKAISLEEAARVALKMGTQTY